MGVNCNYIISNGLRTNKWQGEKKPFFEFVRLWYLGFESVRLMELGFAVWSTPCSIIKNVKSPKFYKRVLGGGYGNLGKIPKNFFGGELPLVVYFLIGSIIF